MARFKDNATIQCFDRGNFMLHDLKASVPQTGQVEWIGIAAEKRAEIEEVQQVEVLPGHGLAGDHHAMKKPDTDRQVTLIQAEHLPIIAALCRRDTVTPDQLRRNIVVSGINLTALKQLKFQIGTAILEGTGACAPCELMEQNLGEGGYQAMRGHGGLTAKVIEPGEIKIGDTVETIPVSSE